MSTNPDQYYLSNRKIANNIVKWYFETCKTADKIANKNSGPQLADQIWAELLIEAISSFNHGLEDQIEPEYHRAAINGTDIVDMVGSDAFNIIAFLVSAQEVQGHIEK
jgi:hypothetical protein